MEKKFPQTLFVSECGSGEDVFLSANRSEQAAITATENETEAEVAEYRLVKVSRRKINTTVIDA